MEAGISYLSVIVVMVFHLTKNAKMEGGKTPIPLMVIFVVLVVWSLYVAIKEDSSVSN